MRRLIALVGVSGAVVWATWAAEAPTPAAPPIAKGVLTSIEPARKKLTIVTRDGLRTFSYTDRTYFFQGRDRLSPELLKSGMVVAVRYVAERDGQCVIQRLKVPQPIDPTAPVEVPPPGP